MCERVALSRHEAGLPGTAIQWGGIGDVGVLADTLGEVEVWYFSYFISIDIFCCFVNHEKYYLTCI